MPISPDADVCVLSNTGSPVITPAGVPLSQVILTFTLLTFNTRKKTSVMDIVSGELVCIDPVDVTLSADGEFTISLWPNSRGDIKTMYKVSASVKSILPFYISVPDEATCTLLAAKTAYNAISAV
ncbi:MAG: hypothetical protein ACOYL3_06990 [Desulfuromonadaceae bacterium]